MPPAELVKNVVWQLEVCNACRYCEGYCAVFPALERRRGFTISDVLHLAHLCHDCRACYYACMFAPPHEFGVNFPRALSEIRRETYARYARPRAAALFAGRGLRFAAITALLSIVGFLLIIALTGEPARFLAAHHGPGAFYAVIPYPLMFLPALIVSAGALALLVGSALRFWRETRGSLRDFLHPVALLEASAEVLGLTYLRGGGAGGCYYPEERTALSRLVLHQLVFYGFIAAFISTSIAFVYQDFLGWLPPYPLLSLPVLFGSVGGIALIIGTTGLICLKKRSDPVPSDRKHVAMDYVFLAVLDLVAITGMLLLVLRETPAMGGLLVLHLGTVFALFLAMPYGKFAHFAYRYAALVQNRVETRHGS